MAEAMERAAVFDYDLQRQLKPMMHDLSPLPSIYYPDFIAANQEDRANNLIPKGKRKTKESVKIIFHVFFFSLRSLQRHQATGFGARAQ